MLKDLRNTMEKRETLREELDGFKGTMDIYSFLEEEDPTIDALDDLDSIDGADGDDLADAIEAQEELAEDLSVIDSLLEEMNNPDPEADTLLDKEEEYEDTSLLDDPADMEPRTLLDKEEEYEDTYVADHQTDSEADTLLDKEEEYEDKIEEIEDVATLDEAYQFIFEDVAEIEREIKENELEKSGSLDAIEAGESMTDETVEENIEDILEDAINTELDMEELEDEEEIYEDDEEEIEEDKDEEEEDDEEELLEESLIDFFM